MGDPAKKNRRVIRWESVKGPRAIGALTVATALGAGLFPFAPGTMGTIAGLPLAIFTTSWHWAARTALWLSVLAIGTWSAKVFDETMGSEDNQNIVIDEVLGLGISSWTAGTEVKTWIAAFVLFRFFDIVKPPPVRQVDGWSKKKAGERRGEISRWYGGFGVMADDVLAGFQALAVIVAAQHFGLLP